MKKSLSCLLIFALILSLLPQNTISATTSLPYELPQNCCDDKNGDFQILHINSDIIDPLMFEFLEGNKTAAEANDLEKISIAHINSERIEQSMLEFSADVFDIRETLSATMNSEDINQIMIEFSERKEIFVDVSDFEEMLSFPKNPDYRYTFMMPLDDSYFRVAPLSSCFTCGQRLFRQRMLRQLTGWMITCPQSSISLHFDIASIYQDAEMEMCSRGCTFRMVSVLGPELSFINCSVITFRHRVRPWQFWADSGFNPHECWHIFNRGSIWDRVPFWR